ncbi:G-protein coupled receptor GRL101 [Exaiptasia diaphana]|nr:G-protein coupled receptor GRL101 [Exaiptasia diaphana]
MTIIFDSGFISLARGFNISYRFIEGCPESCNCRWYLSGDVKRIAVKCKSLTDLPSKIPYETSALMLQENQINTIPNHAFANLPNLLYVDISNNRIFRIKPEAFNNGTSIEVIRLNMNFLMEIPQKTFRPLEHLKTLDLGRNLIKDLTKNTFSGLSELSVLYLQDNNISSLPDGVFQHLSKLIFLNLKDNSLKHLSRNTFRGLLSLMHLNLQGNKLSTISQSLFDDLKRLKTLKVDKFIHCCYAEKAITGVKCESLESNEFSSCDDLMKNTALRIFLWILGLSALVGNLLVICKRISGKEMRQNTNSLLLTNLAITDFLMGVYLITIASFDIKWKGEYFKHDVDWRSGVGCRITGMISMLSSVVSVAFLAIVTYDRLICVVFPFTVKKLSWRKALCICGCVWIVGLVTSIIPIFDFDYFLNDEDDFVGFYGRASVCLPLQLSSNLQAGWEYSVALFLAFPFIAFMFMLIAYIAILRTVQRSANAVRGSTSLKRESSLAKRVVFIILTDFLCWMPVIIISFLSITGIYSDPSKQMYVWIAIFVLPINSSINPFLYTFTTVKTVKSKGQDPGGNMRDNLPAKPLRLKKLLENIDVDGEKKASKICYTIKLLEKVDIKKYFEGEGLFLAKAKSHGYEELSLIKYFNQGKLDAFKKEVDILSELKEHKHENIIEYRWSCLANEHLTDGKPFNIKEIESASLICYEYVPNKVLENFLQDEDEFSSSILCSLSLNIISAIEFLQDCGFSNNSINARSIIVREGESKNAVPVRAVLVDFSRANKLRVYDDGYYAKTDIIQFGRLLKIFLKACNDLALFRQVDEVLSLCDKERTSTTTTLIKNLLMEMLLETAETTAI